INKTNFIIYDKWNESVDLNQLTDLFSESCRIKCLFQGRNKNTITPLKFWQINKQKLIQNANKILQTQPQIPKQSDAYISESIKILRELMYDQG
ncbi:hypothetical protein, partial [Campylobacter jejuni]|uniref:hypothetical protein n=1 Tax=Campylobacter jejuni TaxID=197 RepID=UPI001E5A8E8F